MTPSRTVSAGLAAGPPDLAGTVSTAAGWLAEAGVRPGDVVAVVCTRGSAEFVVARHAALLAGGVVAAADDAWAAEDELAACLRRIGARWLLTSADTCRGKVAAVARQVPGLAGTLVLGVGASPLVAGPALQLAIRRFNLRSRRPRCRPRRGSLKQGPRAKPGG